MTLGDVRRDLGNGAFAPGQVYVALSRVRTTMADRLSLKPPRRADVVANPVLLAFMEWAKTSELVSV